MAYPKHEGRSGWHPEDIDSERRPVNVEIPEEILSYLLILTERDLQTVRNDLHEMTDGTPTFNRDDYETATRIERRAREAATILSRAVKSER